jgi:hypothetical protein
MNRTYVGRVISIELEKAGIKQSELAKKCDMSQPSISAIISSDVRLAPTTMQVLMHCWPTPEANGRVLIAHLRDEIHRAGHDPENALDIRWPNGDRATTAAARSLDVIRRHLADPDVAALVHDIATLLKRAEKKEKGGLEKRLPHPEQPGIAADPHGPDYRTKR